MKKNTKNVVAYVLIVLIMMLSFSVAYTFAYFVNSKNVTTPTLSFGVLELSGAGNQVVNLNLGNIEHFLPGDRLELYGYIGTTGDNQIDAFLRAKVNVNITLESAIASELTEQQQADVINTFKEAFSEKLMSVGDVRDINNTRMWYKPTIPDGYYYYANVFEGGSKFVYGDNNAKRYLNIDDILVNELQGAQISVKIIYQATQVQHLMDTLDNLIIDKVDTAPESLSDYISNVDYIKDAVVWSDDVFDIGMLKINNLNFQVITNNSLVNDNNSFVRDLNGNNPLSSNLMTENDTPRAVAVGGNSYTSGRVIIPEYVKFKKGNWYMSEDGTLGEQYLFDENIFKVTQIAYVPTSSVTLIASELCVPNSENYAFSSCVSGVTELVIPSTINEIQGYAFKGCNNLNQSFVVPDSVTDIKDAVFEGCESIVSVTIPQGTKSIGKNAFCGCSKLEEIAIPESVTSIGDNAFSDCVNLENVQFNAICCSDFNSGNNVFKNAGIEAENGMVFTIGECVENIPMYLLTPTSSVSTAPNVTNIVFDAILCDFYSNNRYLYNYRRDGVNTKVTFGDNVKYIPNYLFSGSKITSVDIGDVVTYIGGYAFNNCSDLHSVYIGKSVNIISNYAFSNANKLREIEFNAIRCENFSYQNYIFQNAGSSNTGEEKLVVTIGEDVEYIPTYLFSPYSNASYAPKLDKIVFNASNCEDFTSSRYMMNCLRSNANAPQLEFGLGITRIPNYLYAGSAFNNIEISNNITDIGDYAFSGCNNLMSIEIPDSVTCIGSGVFSSCVKLESFILPNTITKISKYMFRNCSKLVNVVIPNGVNDIGEYAFESCSKLENLVIPQSITSIG